MGREEGEKVKRRQGLVAFFFLLPGIGLLVIFLLVPSIAVFYFSFTKYSVIEAPEWIGFLNFKELLLEDSIFKIEPLIQPTLP